MNRGYLSLLGRNRDFRRLYIATLISLAGDWFLTVALLDLVLELSGSATLASLIVLCQTLPIFLATPFAGHLIDKMDRKKLMIATDLIRAGAALLPILATSSALLPFAFAGVILISVGAACFDPASQAALPNMVESEDLGAANVLIGSTWGTMLAVGAAIGGLVTMKFGRNVSFLIDSLSFLLSALLLMRIRASFSEVRGKDHSHPPFAAALRETYHYARQHPRVLALLSAKSGYGFSAGVLVMLSVFGRDVFQAGAAGIGLLYAARGVGALAGPFLVRGLARSNNEQYRSITLCFLVFGAGYGALAFSRTLVIGAVMVLIAHLGGGAQWLISSYGLQNEVPDAIRGRVFAADYGFVTLTMSVSAVITGAIADKAGPVFATLVAASVAVVWAVVWGGWTWKLWRGTEQ